jgi:hypothetical protein
MSPMSDRAPFVEAPRSPAFAAWALEPVSLAEFRSWNREPTQLLSRAQAQHLLEYSLLAPSTHNSVPQAYHFDVQAQRLELWLRRERVLPASDPDGREALISLGCAVENLNIAAGQYGIACRWQGASDLDWSGVSPRADSPPVRVGWLDLAPGGLPNDEAQQRATLGNLLARRTLRAEFDGAERLPEDLKSQLEDAASLESAVQIAVFEATRDKFAWGKLDEAATKHKLEERAFQRELGQWLLPNEDQSSVRGMRGTEFGLDDRTTRELSSQLLGDTPMPVDQLAFLARGGRQGLCSAAAVCVLSARNDAPDTAVQIGRVFQRCALLASAAGLGCAVHTALCHVSHIRAMSRATLMRGGPPPTLVFRLGKPRHSADGKRPHASRPQLEELLLKQC